MILIIGIVLLIAVPNEKPISSVYSLVRLVWPNTEEQYFSAVYGSMKDPIAAPGPCEPQECCIKFGIIPAPALFTTSGEHHGYHW